MAATDLYHIGDQPKVTTTFTVDGEPTSPELFEAQYRKPDGTEHTATPVDNGDGVLVTTLPTIDQHGRWFWRVAGTLGVLAADEGDFYVRRSHFTNP